MGICRRNVSHRRVRLASSHVSVRWTSCGRSIRRASGSWDHGAHLHAHLSEYGNDDLDVADNRSAIAAHQLQRLVSADDYVWTRAREQRLDLPKRSSWRAKIGRARPPGAPATGFRRRNLLWPAVA